jgi:hypothetical protein
LGAEIRVDEEAAAPCLGAVIRQSRADDFQGEIAFSRCDSAALPGPVSRDDTADDLHGPIRQNTSPDEQSSAVEGCTCRVIEKAVGFDLQGINVCRNQTSALACRRILTHDIALEEHCAAVELHCANGKIERTISLKQAVAHDDLAWWVKEISGEVGRTGKPSRIV